MYFIIMISNRDVWMDTSMVPNLDIDLLKTFIAIAETGGFTRAADEVNKTQGAVSMQMKRLEELLGRPIVVRDGRPLSRGGRGHLEPERGQDADRTARGTSRPDVRRAGRTAEQADVRWGKTVGVRAAHRQAQWRSGYRVRKARTYRCGEVRRAG